MNQTLTVNHTNSWHGTLDLIYAHRYGSTQLIQNQAQAPLKVQRPFYPEGAAVCHSVILHTAGGMVGSDRLSLNIHLQPHAQALITTAAASKIYRSNGLLATQNIQMQVDAGANLEWLPQETIIFNGAIYRQDIRVELAPGASWLGWEITRFGRTAKGERFLQGEWRSNTEIWQQGRPLWIDRQWLPAREDIINSPHGLAGYPIAASLIWIGQPVSSELVEGARNLWFNRIVENTNLNTGETPIPIDFKTGGTPIPLDLLVKSNQRFLNQAEAGVTRLPHGLLCRYRGNSTTEVRNWFIALWHLLRQSYLERPPIVPRVWQR